ncbi:hypothetical protein [Paraburkholderia elongata]|uniref:Uncharacterized protein n=1 Tax=Paraburkholderia elongata TaxID=2675747 RepID=A0A972NWB2_9BURK|nr:hypothetical protein [Paraburkholderia elongata]NPT54892.1 hypothetical protein [Paraburkholderia elongata]NPT60921.1 hypothetical protein [Paraburkholderia elongata]
MGLTSEVSKKFDKYGLDPDKFDNDFPHRPEPDDPSEDFEDIYESGVAVPPHSAYYDQWVEWLKKNHPAGGGV